MANVVLHVFARNKYSVYVRIDERQILKDLFYRQPLKCLSGISQVKPNAQILKHPKRCCNGGLWDVTQLRRYLMVCSNYI